MKFGLLLIALVFHTCVVASATHVGPNPIKRTVQCQIVDAASGEALTGVQVSIEGTGVTAWSDEEGNFSIELSSDINSKLTCALVSFETMSFELSSLQEGSILLLREK
jgi:hypothetical protein